MDFSMRCWKRPTERQTHARWPLIRAWLCVGLLGACFLVVMPPVHAEMLAPQKEGVELELERGADALYLNARLALDLGDSLEDALRKGIPMHFVWQADVLRSRWYWKDKTVASVSRTVRLAYQPLVRRWRVSYVTGSPGAVGLQYALHQSFETLDDALLSVGRVSKWKLADAGRLDSGETYSVAFRFQLDLSTLPRPFQLGLASFGDWELALQQRLPVPDQPEAQEAVVAPLESNHLDR